MSDVQETLQQLVERRLREMGARHGRTKPLSLLEAYRAIPDGAVQDPVTYEVARRVLKSGHRNIGDRAADTLATMLGVPVGDVLRAAEKRPRLGPFTLPQRADRLNEAERAVVLDVVDTILDAGEGVRAEGDELEAALSPVELYLAARGGLQATRTAALNELRRRGLPDDPADLVSAVEGVLADTGVVIAPGPGVTADESPTGDDLAGRRRGSKLPPLDELAARRGTREDQDPDQ